MSDKRKIEIFSAGCPLCAEGVGTVNRIAGESTDVEVLDMHRPEVAARAGEYGVRSVPAVAVDGKLADCCPGRRVDEATLRAAGAGS
jgi:glutaredoxin 3